MKFIYKAKKGPQEIVEGAVEADNLDAAVKKILRSGYAPLEVKGVDEKAERVKLKTSRPSRRLFVLRRRIPFAEAVSFTRQTSDLIDAGVPVLRALNIISRQTRHLLFKIIIEQICALVKDGGSFSSALARFPDVFPPLYVNMVKSGEVGGNLNVVMRRLAEFLENEQEVRLQIRASLAYPALILVVGSITVFFLLTWVVPRITVIFDDLSESLPLPTRILIGTSSFFEKFWWLILIAVGGIIFYAKKIYDTPHGRLRLDGIKLKIPVLGNFLKDADMGRFARTLGTLLDSGVVIVTALESVSLVVENEILKKEIQNVTQQVAGGSGLAGALKTSSLFPEATVNMVAVAEETGQVHNGLYKLAVYYERRCQRTIKTITSLMEPVLILGVGLVVGFVILAILMPILQMNLIIK